MNENAQPVTMQSDAGPPPRVSVCMSVYNAQRYLAAAVESVLAQTHRDFELICVNDGSTDRSLAMLQCYAMREPRMRVVTRGHAGVVRTANDAIRMARGEYIARFDADDVSVPHRLATQVAYLDAHPQIIGVSNAVVATDPYGSPCGQYTPPADHADIDASLMRGSVSVFPIQSSMIRRAAYWRVGGFRPLDPMDDVDLMLRLAETGQLANIEEPLCYYRRHFKSLCMTYYAEIRDRIEGVVHEAYERRGLAGRPTLAEIRPDLGENATRAQTLRAWACHAIHHSNRGVALRHALAAMWREPFSVLSWKVLAWSATVR